MATYRRWVLRAALVLGAGVALVLGAGVALVLPAGAAAAAGVLSGRVLRLPAARGLSFAEAYAIDPDSGDVAATAGISHAGFRVSLAPGPYLPAVAAQSAHGESYGGFGAAVTVRAGATARANVKVRALSASATAARARAGARVSRASAHARRGDPFGDLPTAAAHAASGGAIYTVGSVALDAQPGARIPSYQLSDHVLALIFNRCTAQGTRFVDTGAAFVAAARREQQLSEAGRLATKVRYEPLHAQYAVTGHGTATKQGQVTLELELTDSATHESVQPVTVSGSVKQLESLIDELAAKFAAAHCTPPPPALPENAIAVPPPALPALIPTPRTESNTPKDCPDEEALQNDASSGGTVRLGEDCRVELTEPLVIAGGESLKIEAAPNATIVAAEGVETGLFIVQAAGALTLEGVALEDGVALGENGESAAEGSAGEPGEPGGPAGSPGGDGGEGGAGPNGEAGGDGRGGAVENAGTLTIIDSRFVGDSADGGSGGDGGMGGVGGAGAAGSEGARRAGGAGGKGGTGGKSGAGGDGGDGGDGQGGAIYNAAGATLTITASTFVGDGATGGGGGHAGEAGVGGAGGDGGRGGEGAMGSEGNYGAGGTGKVGGAGGPGGTGGDAGDGGSGGAGGSGQGGAIYNAGTLSVSDTTFLEDGAQGLFGGAGGDSDFGGPGGEGGIGGRGGQGGNGHCAPEEGGVESKCGAGGGDGANGGVGGAGGDGGDVGKGGDNGDGGDAQGGAIYSLATPDTASDSFSEDAVDAGIASGLDCTTEFEEPQFDCPGHGEFPGAGASAPGLGGLGGLTGGGGGPGNGGVAGKSGSKAGAKGGEGAPGNQGSDGNLGNGGAAEGIDVYP